MRASAGEFWGRPAADPRPEGAIMAATMTEVMHDAGEVHGIVHKIVNGDDADWASWYSDWLINLSPLPDLLGFRPVRSELTYVLVQLDKDFTAQKPDQSWEEFY